MNMVWTFIFKNVQWSNLFHKVSRNPALKGNDFEAHVLAGAIIGLSKLHDMGIARGGSAAFRDMLIDKDGHLMWINFHKAELLVRWHSLN